MRYYLYVGIGNANHYPYNCLKKQLTKYDTL